MAARGMATAASALLDALDPGQRARATFAFDDEKQRTDWAYYPRDHAGLPLHDMDIRQQKAAHRLLAISLALPAYAKTCAIMSLESVLNEIEQRRGDAVRDPGRYFFSFFGETGPHAWGWRLEGHHVCLNFTCIGDDAVSATPLFLGANPAEVRHGDATALRPCGEEEDAARSFLALLDDGQRALAVVSDIAPPDFVLTNMPRVPGEARPGEYLPPRGMARRAIEPVWEAFAPHAAPVAFSRSRPIGIPATALDGRQRAALDALVAVYIERLPEPMASRERERIAGGADSLHFAWAGSLRRREGHYYRLHGPAFLVEYDNTQDGANHVHTVWRHPDRDFGYEPLRAHVASSH